MITQKVISLFFNVEEETLPTMRCGNLGCGHWEPHTVMYQNSPRYCKFCGTQMYQQAMTMITKVSQ
jgi:hypothetical protein